MRKRRSEKRRKKQGKARSSQPRLTWWELLMVLGVVSSTGLAGASDPRCGGEGGGARTGRGARGGRRTNGMPRRGRGPESAQGGRARRVTERAGAGGGGQAGRVQPARCGRGAAPALHFPVRCPRPGCIPQ